MKQLHLLLPPAAGSTQERRHEEREPAGWSPPKAKWGCGCKGSQKPGWEMATAPPRQGCDTQWPRAGSCPALLAVHTGDFGAREGLKALQGPLGMVTGVPAPLSWHQPAPWGGQKQAQQPTGHPANAVTLCSDLPGPWLLPASCCLCAGRAVAPGAQPALFSPPPQAAASPFLVPVL